jgi:isoprenylcysteine carboxyl methyltransferase (ICMT) family protein YpbQ
MIFLDHSNFLQIIEQVHLFLCEVWAATTNSFCSKKVLITIILLFFMQLMTKFSLSIVSKLLWNEILSVSSEGPSSEL